MAWDAFGIKNGVTSLEQLEKRISKYRSRNKIDSGNPQIGCIILTEPFFFDELDWIPVPEDWSNSIVRGKRYSTDTLIGKRLYDEVKYRLPSVDYVAEGERYTISETKHRLGQGAFRIVVADAYQRRCAITGEKTLPVLEAAHIKPYGKGGEHSIPNGILLKSDFHTLFDKGYITIDTDYRINVSDKLHSDYGNCQPSKTSLQWHNENVYLG